MNNGNWDERRYYGRFNKYPYIEVVTYVMRTFGSAPDRSRIRILDLGFGGAHHLLFLAAEGFDYYGIDGSRESLTIGRERLAASGYSSATLSVGELGALPYEDEFFDCVIDRGSLVCNRLHEIPALIDESHRVLKPGGKMFSMIFHQSCTFKEGAVHLGDNDYTDIPGRLQKAGILHLTNVQEAAALFARFDIDDIELITRRSEYMPANNHNVVSWMVTSCSKPQDDNA